MEELAADAAVETDAARDFLHVGADLLAEIGHFVDEGDLGGQERVRRVFDEFRRLARGEDDRRLVQIERAIDFLDDVAGALGLGADDDPVGTTEILDGRAFAQEFRIGGDVELGLGTDLADDVLDLLAGADGNGRFRDDHRIVGERTRDFLGGAEHEAQIGMAVAATAGRADGDEDGVGLRHGRGEVGRERKPSRARIGGDDFVEARFEDRNAALVEIGDLALVLVDADDVVTELRQTGARYKPHIAAADHRDTHKVLLSPFFENGSLRF